MSPVRETDPDVVITHPNRDSAAAKGTRAAAILVQLASAALLLFTFIASLGAQAGAQGLWLVLTALFAYYAYAIVNWRSGVLPIAAGTAVVSGVFAAVSIPGWFDRGGSGYESPALPEELIGVIVLAFAVLQLVNVVVSLRGFAQNWQVELEVPRSQATRYAA